MTGKILPILILLSAVSLIGALPQPAQFICAVVQVFWLPGLVFSYFVLGGRVSRADQWVLSILLSPVLVAMLTFAVNLLAGDIYLSGNIVVIFSYILFAVALAMGRHRPVGKNRVEVPRMIYVVSFAYAGLILISYLINDFLLIRADAWYHAAVTREVMDGEIPPNEPLLANFSIMYMWFYHLFQAVWIKRSGLPVLSALAFFNIMSALVFPYLAARFASYFTDKRHVIVLAALFAVAGLDSASWILWPVGLVRALIGDVTGMAEIKRVFSEVTFDGARVIRFLKPQGTWQVNWNDKFLTITAFSYSFNMFLACLILVLKENFLTRSRAKLIAMLFFMVLGTFLFHIVSGVVLIYALVGSAVFSYLSHRYLYRDKRPLSDYYVPVITAILVSAFALPYMYSLISGGYNPEGESFAASFIHIGLTSILTILFPLAILFFPARAAFRKLFSGSDHVSRTMVAWIVCLLALCIFINIGTVGEKKLIYFLFIVIGPPIYIQIVEKIGQRAGAKRALLIAAVLVLFFIPPFLTFRGFMMEKPNDELWSRRYAVTSDDMRLFAWLEENTPGDAVIIEADNYHLSPVYAGRRNLYSDYNIISAQGYGGPKMELYESIQTAVYGSEPLTHKLVDDMTKVQQKLFIAVWEDDIKACPWLEGRFESHPEWFKVVYDSARVSLYTLNEDIP